MKKTIKKNHFFPLPPAPFPGYPQDPDPDPHEDFRPDPDPQKNADPKPWFLGIGYPEVGILVLPADLFCKHKRIETYPNVLPMLYSCTATWEKKKE